MLGNSLVAEVGSGCMIYGIMQTNVPSHLHFDPQDPTFAGDPYPTLGRFRQEAPIYYWEKAKGYLCFRYQDMLTLLKEPRLGMDASIGAGLSAELRTKFPDYAALHEHGLSTLRPKDHARIRKIINPLFGPQAIEAYRPHIKQILTDVLDTLPRCGVINVFSDFSRKYPVRIIAALLNIAPGAEADFVALADALIATLLPTLSPEAFASYMPPISRGLAIVRQCIAERRKQPIEGDLLSRLISACDDQDRLSDGELYAMIAALLIAGSDTTVHLTTYALLELLRHPDQLALLRKDPSLARLALDETLRHDNFNRVGLFRFANETFPYQGFTFERGQPVLLSIASALRDPEFVPDAEVFDIRRRVHASPWFGHGPHFCIGASLTRLEAENALQLFLERYPKIELAGEPVYGTHEMFRDITNLPIHVQAN